MPNRHTGPDRLIRLDGPHSTFVVDARGDGVPRCAYWGSSLPADTDLETFCDAQARPVPRNALDADTPPTLVPLAGFDRLGAPALSGSCADGRSVTALVLTHLTREADGVVLALDDAAAGLGLEVHVAIDPQTGVLSLRSALHNRGPHPYRLDWLAAGTLPLPLDAAEALVFDGQWNREFHERRIVLGQGIAGRENRRGRTSHDAFPGLIAGQAGFGETRGAVYGFHLGWSGNHRLAVETDVEGARLVQAGELPMPGEIVLESDERYDTPILYAAFSEHGLNGLSDAFHRFVRRRVLVWPNGVMAPRPVTFNSWEAVYFHHDLKTLSDLADVAAEVGAERFVLDDGWFGDRDDDTSSLGDWTPDHRKWPDGLTPLIDHVRGLGMSFGLWVEPEMVNPDSDLYRAHPDWALHADPLPRPTGRHQLVLDLTNPEAFAHIHVALDALLQHNRIDYLKWDMNRDLAPGTVSGRAAVGRQTRAVYALIDRLRADHPHVEIESCSSGGARADLGILSRTHRIWPSDCNDALERQTIQRGFSRFFPPELMGAHVGPPQSHTTGRRLTLAFRATTALFGHMGMELDLRTLDRAHRTELTGFITLHKRFRDLLHSGQRVYADDPDESRLTYGTVRPDAGEGLFCIAQLTTSAWRTPPTVRLPGLDPARTYRLTLPAPPPLGCPIGTPMHAALAEDGGVVLPGALLTRSGFQPPPLWPASALVMHAVATDAA
ncbi:MAG: alpha-galactosidase [Inquilinaceae bacterium]